MNKLQEFDIDKKVVKTKFATRLMQKRGIEGPRKYCRMDIYRNWAVNKVPKKYDDMIEQGGALIAIHGDDIRFINEKTGNYYDIINGAPILYKGDQRKKVKFTIKTGKFKNNLVKLK